MSTRDLHESIERARRAADRYLALGLVPLPSREDEKRPTLDSFKECRRTPLDPVFYGTGMWDTTNLQLMTGQTHGSSRIIVVDCDGEEAKSVWGRMHGKHGVTNRTWVCDSPSGGMHVYYGIPAGLRVKTRMIWGLWDTWGDDGKGRWTKHKEVKILGDGALVVAPPSFHVEHRDVRYAFRYGCSPVDLPTPVEAPQWLLDMPAVVPPMKQREVRPRVRMGGYAPIMGLDRIQDAIPVHEKISLAMEWGLRMSGKISSTEWIHCHSVGREDNQASAGFHAATGRYKDHVTGEVLTFFQLGVALGRFQTAAKCAEWCSYHCVIVAGR